MPAPFFSSQLPACLAPGTATVTDFLLYIATVLNCHQPALCCKYSLNNLQNSQSRRYLLLLMYSIKNLPFSGEIIARVIENIFKKNGLV